MREAGIGRVLVASLHQGIADILPTRLGFYENWLNAEGLRDGTIGLAPLYAVLSFLRQEGDAYQLITTRAGEYAAEWTVQSMPPVQRAIIRAAPMWLRSRLLLRLARQLVRSSYRGSRAIARLRSGTAQRRRARVDFLHGARAGAVSRSAAFTRPRSRVARALQLRGADRGRRVPRHGRSHLSAEDRDPERPDDGDRRRRHEARGCSRC